MKKKLARKVMPVTSSNGKRFMNSLDALFRARTQVEVSNVFPTCLRHATTLTLIRSLYSWVVAPHGLSAVDFSRLPWMRIQVMDRWQEMIECQLIRIRSSEKLMSDWTIWRAVHELSPADTGIGEYIRRVRDSFEGCNTPAVRRYPEFGSADLYLEVHDEILGHPSRIHTLHEVSIAA